MTITFDDTFGLRKPATMSADEVLIRAREAVIEAYQWQGKDMWGGFRAGKNDGSDDCIQAILAYERDRAKPLAEVAPHTAEDPDDRVAYEMYAAMADYADTWAKRETSPWYLSIRAAIKRGRELERGE